MFPQTEETISFWQDHGECDFVVSEDENVRQLVQVSWRMNEDSQTGRKIRKREIDGLVAAAEALNCEIIGYNGAVGGHAEYYNRGGTLEVNGYIVVGAFNSSNPGYAYMEVDGGLVTNKANEIIVGDSSRAATMLSFPASLQVRHPS